MKHKDDTPLRRPRRPRDFCNPYGYGRPAHKTGSAASYGFEPGEMRPLPIIDRFLLAKGTGRLSHVSRAIQAERSACRSS